MKKITGIALALSLFLLQAHPATSPAPGYYPASHGGDYTAIALPLPTRERKRY